GEVVVLPAESRVGHLATGRHAREPHRAFDGRRTGDVVLADVAATDLRNVQCGLSTGPAPGQAVGTVECGRAGFRTHGLRRRVVEEPLGVVAGHDPEAVRAVGGDPSWVVEPHPVLAAEDR